MNINTVNSNNDITMHGKGNGNPNWFRRQIRRLEQKVLDTAPSHTTKEHKKSIEKWDKINHLISDPMWNRGILGATALATQPAIDYYNHRVDEETRTVSRNRTIAKILSGTLVGMFVVRGPIYKLVEKMTDVNSKNKFGKTLLPQKYIESLKKNQNQLMNYRSSIAMALALAAMIVTNVALDAPLTIILTNYFNNKSGIKNKDNLENKNTKNINEKMEVRDA